MAGGISRGAVRKASTLQLHTDFVLYSMPLLYTLYEMIISNFMLFLPCLPDCIAGCIIRIDPYFLQGIAYRKVN
eukprot:12774229-Ditylum_brightwellii.AAC.1